MLLIYIRVEVGIPVFVSTFVAKRQFFSVSIKVDMNVNLR